MFMTKEVLKGSKIMNKCKDRVSRTKASTKTSILTILTSSFSFKEVINSISNSRNQCTKTYLIRPMF